MPSARYIDLADYATLDGTTDALAGLNTARDDLVALGGGVILVTGPTAISDTFYPGAGVSLQGIGYSAATTSQSGPAASDFPCYIKAIGDSFEDWAGKYVIHVVGATDNFIFGFHMDQLPILGANLAYGGLRLSSTRNAHIPSLWIERCLGHMLMIDDGGAYTVNPLTNAHTYIGDYRYDSGASTGAQYANGLTVQGVNNDPLHGGVTQLVIGAISGTHQNGDGVSIGDCDSSTISHIEVGPKLGFTGTGVRMRGISDSQTNTVQQLRAARKMRVLWFAGHSDFYVHDLALGSVWINSEGTSLTQEGFGAFSVEGIVNRNSGQRFSSVNYKLQDVVDLPLNGGDVIAGTAYSVSAQLYGSVPTRVERFAHGETKRYQWTFGQRREWSYGEILGFDIQWVKFTRPNTGNVMLEIAASDQADGNNFDPGVNTKTVTLTVDAANEGPQNSTTILFDTPVVHREGQTCVFRFSRIGSNVADTFTDDFALISIRVIYFAGAGYQDGTNRFRYVPPADAFALIPANVGLPIIAGTAGVGNVLNVQSKGVWANRPTSYAYRWKRDGVNISAATAPTYTQVTADSGHSLTCTVTATNVAGSTAATSNTIMVP